jgi:hypothetical protein
MTWQKSPTPRNQIFAGLLFQIFDYFRPGQLQSRAEGESERA